MNRPEEGLEYIETSIELDGDDPDYHEALGRCFMALNLFDKAKPEIKLSCFFSAQIGERH